MRGRRPGPRSRAVASTVVLLLASLVPSPLERHSGWDRFGPDKFLHFLGHAGYVVTLADAFSVGRRSHRRAALLAVCVSTVHSLLAGRLQRHVPGRVDETGDVLAALSGGSLAAVAWYARTGGRTDDAPTERPDRDGSAPDR